MALRDPLAAIAIFIFSLTFFLIARNYTGGAQVFPQAITVVMMICSVLLFVQSIYRPSAREEKPAGAGWKVAVCIAGTVALIIAVDYIGYITAGFIYVPLTAYFLGVRNHVAIWFSTAFFVVLVAYLFFRSVFHVPLPKELILTLF